jgi:1-acyl-sn-glycerol-3-phosphate acyltransferase
LLAHAIILDFPVSGLICLSTPLFLLYSSTVFLTDRLECFTYKIPSSFFFKGLAKLVLTPFLSPKYNPHYEIIDDINECDGPCFLIYNHQSRIDYVYTVEAAYPKKLNYVIGYNEFFRSHLQFVFKLLNCIPKKNFNADIPAIKAISRIIKQGGCVYISPEGMSSITGHNQPVFTGTGKLFKHHKVPV